LLNAISVDVEEYFHVEAFAKTLDLNTWDSFESRVEASVDKILDLFQQANCKATFFILGWVTERRPSLIKKIANAGHEIGCHGFGHQRIHRQAPEEFRKDIRKAQALLEDCCQQRVNCYRAPSFSVTQSTIWALDVLYEEGFTIDSSIFPIRHDLYGMPNEKRFPHDKTTPKGNTIFEFPPSTIKVAGNNIGTAGGGYLRLLPYAFTRWAIRHINTVENQPAMVYFHPWEVDPNQPRISAPLRSKVRHYTNLHKMENKIRLLLKEFNFSTVSEVCWQLPAFKQPPINALETVQL
jgi:polysaccharide deacetylase family protein (PEP-CTERM system associated)